MSRDSLALSLQAKSVVLSLLRSTWTLLVLYAYVAHALLGDREVLRGDRVGMGNEKQTEREVNKSERSSHLAEFPLGCQPETSNIY